MSISEIRGRIKDTESYKKIPRLLMNEEYRVHGLEVSKSEEIPMGVQILMMEFLIQFSHRFV